MEMDKKVCNQSKGLINENNQMLPSKKDKNAGVVPFHVWLLSLARQPIWKMAANAFNIQKVILFQHFRTNGEIEG